MSGRPTPSSRVVAVSAVRRALASERSALAFVWSLWALMLLGGLICISLYGRNVPLAEDWLLVAPLTGNEPEMAEWLWSQNNEHRVPLPRLLFLALLKLSGGDFRSGMVFNVLALGALAAAMIRTARRVRGGRTRYADAFFPLALLHLGNWPNLVWSWQLQFVVATVLTCALLLLVVRQQGLLKPGTALAAGACLVLLPLCGANGLIFAAAMAPWLAFEGWLHWRSKEGSAERKWIGRCLFGFVAAALLLAGLYFVGYERAAWNPPSPGLAATLKTSAKFLALGFGPAAARSWALSVLAAAAVLLSSAVLLSTAVLRLREAARRRAMGLLLFCGGLAILALAVGWGRAGLVSTVGLPDRYTLLAVPAFCAAYFIWVLYGPRVSRRFVLTGLLVGMSLLAWPNTQAGFAWRDWYVRGMSAFEQDLRAGVPRSVLAERHHTFLLHWDQTKLESGLHMLKRAGIGPFQYMREQAGTTRVRHLSSEPSKIDW